MDDKLLDRLFSGDVEKLIPFPRRVVRLFISSTFTDMTLERNSLMERVYPKLKKYCREKHGLDFQVVDMRWGVRDEATDDHQTANLCSREIDNCQRVSLGPNFVALIGDKYGFRPLLNRIKSSEYRALRRCLIELDTNTDFLDTWYKEDLNAVPPEYLLQPISSILKNFTNRNEPELQSVDQRIWMAIQERLHELLMIGSSRLVKQGRMSEREQLMKYSISVTEREVIEGCLDVNDAKSHCLVYVRSITDLKSQLSKCLANLEALSGQSPVQQSSLNASSPGENSIRRKSSGSSQGENRKASLKIGEDSISLTTGNAQTAAEKRAEKIRRLIGRYIDLRSRAGTWELDEAAQLALENLRSNKLANKLPTNGKNSINYQIHWSENDGLTLKSEEHKHYLNELTEHFYSNLTRMIRKASKKETSVKSGLIGEVLQHSHYAKHVSKTFHGRRNELDKIRAYILWPSDFGAIPMFLYGVDGSGKTSVLARAATLVQNWITAQENATGGGGAQVDESKWDQKPCIIMRFCCTTPSSSSMIGVLTSVCRQLQYNFYQFGPLNGVVNQLGGNSPESATSKRENGELQLAYERIPDDFVRLVFVFRRLLDNCQHHYHKRRKFIIILDSIDRLSSPAESSIEVKYSWLTSIVRLPPNVRLLVSCSSDVSSSKVEDFKYLKRHFLELNLTHRKRSASLSSLATSNSSSLEDRERSIGSSQQLSSDFLAADRRPSLKTTEIAVDRYRFVKRVIVPAVRLLSRHNKADKTGAKSSGTNLDVDQKWKISPTFGLDNLLAPRRRDSVFNRESGGARDGAPRTSIVSSRESLDDFSEDYRIPPRAQSSWILHVKPMGVSLAIGVIQRWLAEYGRTLTRQQWRILENSFGHCSRPIFVKLAFGEVLNWKSYSTQSDARGLTFGSTLLASEDLAKMSRLNDGGVQGEVLEKLMKHCCGSSDNEFIWQVLTMEQQWLNYLDFRQRLQSRDSVEDKSGQAQQQQDGSLVIRVGTQAGAMGDGLTGPMSGCSLSTSICHLSNTINDAICQLFARIELQHGYILTKHSLSYITAARNGICENELEDILSLDDVVLDDVFQYHLPPVRRIPPLLWTRIRNDLPDYLSERDADGMIVVNWHHSQFKKVTLDRYLVDPRQRVYIYSTMADYFLGKWADKPKPFRCTKQQIQMAAEQLESAVQQSIRDSQSSGGPRSSLSGSRLTHGGSASVRTGTSFSVRNRLRSSDQRDSRLQWMQAKADRRVPHQPLFYSNETSGSDGGGDVEGAKMSANNGPNNGRRPDETSEVRWQKRKYNLRKITELPYHLMCAGRFVDLANHVLFNYNWLSAAIDSTGLQALLGDFREARVHMELAIGEKPQASKGDEVASDGRAASRDHSSELESIPELPERPLEENSLRSLLQQMDILSNALRLSSSAIHSDTQMLAPQLLSRLLPLVQRSRLPTSRANNSSLPPNSSTEHLEQLLDQCDKDGSNDCSLLPIDHCLQSPNGLQMSSLEGHSFAVMSIAMATDQRHLLAVSNKFIMWDVSTGEVARDIDPKIEGSIMLELKIGINNQYAIAYTSDSLVIVLDILTQQVAKFEPKQLSGPVIGMNLIDRFGATRFLIWTSVNWLVLRVVTSDEYEKPSGFVSMAQKFRIEAEYSMELNDIYIEQGSQILSVDHDFRDDTTFVRVASKLDPDKSVNSSDIILLTLKTNDGIPSKSLPIALWPQNLPSANAMALNLSLDQLVFACAAGNIYLSRRRKTRWSRPKLLDLRKKAEYQDTGNLSAILMAEESWSEAEREKFSSVPQAIDLDSNDSIQDNLDKFSIMDDSKRAELSKFERQVDNLSSNELEVKATEVFSRIVSANRSDESDDPKGNGVRKNPSSPASIIRLYYGDRVIVLYLEKSLATTKTLILPRDVRNVCIESNKSQIRSTIVRPRLDSPIDSQHLVVAAGRRLLFYSIGKEQLIKSVEAHGGRILKLLPILASDFDFDDKQCVATASMDKTVNIWNLSNLNKETHSIDKMDGPIDYLCLAPQRPLAACLAKGNLALYDWRTLKLVGKLLDSELERLETKSNPTIIGCKFSVNSRYLCLSTQRSVHLYSLEGPRSPLGSSSKSSDAPNMRPIFAQLLPVSGTIRAIKFFLQDSRLLLIVDCPNDRAKRNSGSSETTSSGTTSNDSGAISEHLLSRVVACCFSVPDGRFLYKIDHYSPIMGNTGDTQYLAAAKSAAYKRNPQAESRRVRLPALTKDELHVVTVEFRAAGQVSAEKGPGLSPEHRRSSAMIRIPLELNIYSTRDGCLAKSIDLSQLEHVEIQMAAEKNGLQTNKLAANHDHRASMSMGETSKSQLQRRLVCITSDQFTHLKSVSYLERQSVVALVDDNKGSSFLIDIYTKQLVCSSAIWSGKVSSDGRYGLSRMFKSASLRKSISVSGQKDANSTSLLNSDGLQLLEMRHCRPVKTLLSNNQLFKLSGQDLQTTGSNLDITCGFTTPNNLYVYCYNSRLKRLLLIRARDNKLIANYKLSVPVSRIKCTSDGYSFVLSHTDGSLTSLAIVDPQQSDTLTRLGQFPSRRKS